MVELSRFNVPKNPGFGEDADPVFYGRTGEWWLAAFDGAGGAGAQTYETAEGTRTGAYLASRIAADTVSAWVTRQDVADRSAKDLEDELSRALSDAAARLPQSGGMIKSRMIRPLPTTAAILQVCAPHTARPGFPFVGRALWAGDSRVFVLRPDRGLVQYTRDHLREPLDPFENLTADSPMSNFLSADGRFELAEAYFEVETPFIGIAATDGCFGYVESPVVFEYMLLHTLRQAHDLTDWMARLKDAIGMVAADDASAAVGLFGWSFERARSAFERRWAKVQRKVDDLEAAREAVARAERTRLDVWADYRQDYEGYEPWGRE